MNRHEREEALRKALAAAGLTDAHTKDAIFRLGFRFGWAMGQSAARLDRSNDAELESAIGGLARW